MIADKIKNARTILYYSKNLQCYTKYKFAHCTKNKGGS